MTQATLNQIAAKAGVSRATAARILGSDVQYQRPTFAKRAQKIRRMAEELGYRPNAAAKAISTGRFQHVGLLMGTHYERSNFTREMIRGMHDALQQKQMHLSLWFLDDDQLADEAHLPRFLEQQMVDGLLVNYTHALPAHMQEAIDRAGLPVVWLNLKREHDSVYPDDIGAGRKAVEHLRGLGHRRIAFADFTHGPGNKFLPHYSVLDRRAGYEQAMADAGLSPQNIAVPHELDGYEAVVRAAAVLASDDAPTAVVCQSPRDAEVFHMAAVARQQRVPRDLSLVTFGPDRVSGTVLDMTRLTEPREMLGLLAAQALLRRIDQPNDPCPARQADYQLHPGASASTLAHTAP